MIETLLIIILAYFLLMFAIPMLVIPNLWWKRRYDKNDIPKDVMRKMMAIGKTGTKRKVLEKALKLQYTRFYAKTMQVWVQWRIWFVSSFRELWNKGGFIHCHQHDLVLRHLLLASGRFKEEDIKIRITNYRLNIHQYILVNVGENGKKDWIKVDAFAVGIGYDIGEVLSWQGAKAGKRFSK